MRLNLVVLIGILLGLGAAVYNVADRAQQKEKRIARLDRKIAHEQEALRVLGAEWTYLTNPTRLEKIAVKHLNLEPMDGRQYIALGAVPLRATLDAEESRLAAAEAPPPAQPVAQPVILPPSNPDALPRRLSLTQISTGVAR